MSDYGFSDPRTSDPRDYRRSELARGSGDVKWDLLKATVLRDQRDKVAKGEPAG